MDFDTAEIAFTASVWILPVLVAVTLHEAAHGWVAWRLGDDTAYRMGRVTFNPIKHIDPFGTILLPSLMLIGTGGQGALGWAKPVPVRFNRLIHPRRDMILVALAGPGTNIILALASAVLLHSVTLLEGSVREWVNYSLVISVKINLVLAVFNMLPLPPLDGGRVAVGILPAPLATRLARLERFGMFIIIGGIFVLPMIGNQFGIDLNIFTWLIWTPVQFLLEVVSSLVGLG